MVMFFAVWCVYLLTDYFSVPVSWASKVNWSLGDNVP